MTTTDTKPNEMPVRGNPRTPPNVAALLQAFQTCSPWSRSGWNRVQTNDNVRFNRGSGHTTDCRKHGTRDKPAFPWESASNQKSFLADAIIGEITDYLVIAFWRSWMTPKAGTHAVSNYAVKLLDWIVNTECTDQLETHVELSASYLHTYGWVGLHPRWEFEIALERKVVTLDDLTGIAQALSERLDEQGSAGSASPALLGLLNLPALIADPDLEIPAIESLDLAWQGYAMQQVGRSDVSLPPLSRATLRQGVRELRETGQAALPVPYVCRNQPSIHALKPWEELLIPNNATEVDRTPAFRVAWFSEPDLRAKQLTEDWDPGWIEEAIKHKGKFSAWSLATAVNGDPGSNLTERMSGGVDSVFSQADTKSELIEVIFATYPLVDEDNVRGVYLTILHPMVGKEGSGISTASSHAWHGLLPSTRGRSPYIIGRREHVAPAITSSRGLPEIIQSYQAMTKIQIDGAMDWTSLGVLPPINEYATAIKTTYKYGPAVRNTVQQGKEPKFMDIPGNGVPVAFEMLERIETWVDGYVGRKNVKHPPDVADMRTQKRVTSFLMLWTRALMRTLDLCQERMDDAQFAEITGAPPGWLEGNRKAPGLLAARLECDIRELNPEYVTMMLKTVNEAVIPQDVGGVTNRTEWTRAQWQMINPRLARSIVNSDGDASEQMFEKVKIDVGLMFNGQEAKYTKNDPAAEAKLGYVKQVLTANPNYLAGLQEGGRFRDLLTKYVDSLQFSLTERDNAKVGAVGVQPDAMENA